MNNSESIDQQSIVLMESAPLNKTQSDTSVFRQEESLILPSDFLETKLEYKLLDHTPCSSKTVRKCDVKATKIKRYPCPICKKHCPSKLSRKKHLDTHFGKQGIISYCIQFAVEGTRYVKGNCKESLKEIHSSDTQANNIGASNKSILEVPSSSLKTGRAYNCGNCAESFSSKFYRRKHQCMEFYYNQHEHIRCKICFKIFSEPVGLKIHLDAHLGEKPYNCGICSNTLPSKSSLKLHLNNHHHELTTVICKICFTMFRSRIKFARHMYQSHRQISKKLAPYECLNCQQRFTVKRRLARHLKCYKSRDACKFCKKILYTRFHLRKHIIEMHVQKPYSCNICKRDFTTASSFKCHLLLEQRTDNDSVKKCEICLQRFFNDGALRAHMKKSHQTFACDICYNRFATKNLHRIHVRDVHEANENLKEEEINQDLTENTVYSKTFTCSQCQKSYSNKKCLNVHIRSKHYQVKCLLCESSFDSHSKLVKHLEIHIDQKPFVCKLCSCEFAFRKDILRHTVAEHDKSKEVFYKCEVCSIHFYHWTPLTKHRAAEHKPDFSDVNAIKVERRSFKCQRCEKSYDDEEKLNRHMKLHEFKEACVFCKEIFYSPSEVRIHLYSAHVGRRPHFCPLCSSEFSSIPKFKNHLKVEQRKRSRGNRFKCHICPEEFYFKATLSAHVLKVHFPKQKTVVGAPHLTEDDALYKCHVCQKLYIDHDQFTRHVKLHGFSDNCKICSKEFTVRFRLMRHLEEHIGDRKPYVCLICNRLFDNKKTLKEHLTVEQGKNSYKTVMKCWVCGWHYYHKISFMKHVRVQHQKQPLTDEEIMSRLTFENYLRNNPGIKMEIEEGSLELHNFLNSDGTNIKQEILDPPQNIANDDNLKIKQESSESELNITTNMCINDKVPVKQEISKFQDNDDGNKMSVNIKKEIKKEILEP